MRTERQAWGIINRERKRGKGVNAGIDMESWRGYFMKLLRGVETRVVRRIRKGGDWDEERD